MPEMSFESKIQCPIEDVFRLIADIEHYDKWLPSSDSFGTIEKVSDNPIRRGTTYVDKGQQVPLHGVVIVFQEPQKIAFQQSARLQRFPLYGSITITIEYELIAENTSTQVLRHYQLELGGMLRLLQAILVRNITVENERILKMMKQYLEQR